MESVTPYIAGVLCDTYPRYKHDYSHSHIFLVIHSGVTSTGAGDRNRLLPMMEEIMDTRWGSGFNARNAREALWWNSKHLALGREHEC